MLVNVKDQELLKLNKLIEENSYKDAEELIKSFDHAKVIKDFNMGYLYFKKGELVNSRMLLERAKYGGMISFEVDEALGDVKTKLDIKLVERDISVSDSFILESVSFSTNLYPTIFLGLLIISFILFWKKLKWASLINGMLSLIVIGMYFGIKDYQINYNLEEAVVYRGPSKIFEEVQILPPGGKFIISKKIKDWKYIKYPSIYKGWVYKNKALNL